MFCLSKSNADLCAIVVRHAGLVPEENTEKSERLPRIQRCEARRRQVSGSYRVGRAQKALQGYRSAVPATPERHVIFCQQRKATIASWSFGCCPLCYVDVSFVVSGFEPYLGLFRVRAVSHVRQVDSKRRYQNILSVGLKFYLPYSQAQGNSGRSTS